MSISLVLASLRRALPSLPLEWVLWSLDAEGVLLAHEGPGAPRSGEGVAVGRSVWEVYGREAPILDFATRVLREPAAAEVVSGGARIHLAGAPVEGGGAVGLALVLERMAGVPDPAPTLPPAVLELLRPVPQIGALAGDLLLWNPERPAKVGLYREMPAARLPLEVARDLRLTRSSGERGSSPPAPAGGARPLRERAAHLRVVS